MLIRTLSLVVTIAASVFALIPTASACPLPSGRTVQLEWAVTTSGEVATWFEVVEEADSEAGVRTWSDAIYREDGALVWAGELTCDGPTLLLQADYVGEGIAADFEQPLPLETFHPASVPWPTAGVAHPATHHLSNRLGETIDLTLLAVTRSEQLASVSIQPLQALRADGEATAQRLDSE